MFQYFLLIEKKKIRSDVTEKRNTVRTMDVFTQGKPITALIGFLCSAPDCAEAACIPARAKELTVNTENTRSLVITPFLYLMDKQNFLNQEEQVQFLQPVPNFEQKASFLQFFNLSSTITGLLCAFPFLKNSLSSCGSAGF